MSLHVLFFMYISADLMIFAVIYFYSYLNVISDVIPDAFLSFFICRTICFTPIFFVLGLFSAILLSSFHFVYCVCINIFFLPCNYPVFYSLVKLQLFIYILYMRHPSFWHSTSLYVFKGHNILIECDTADDWKIIYVNHTFIILVACTWGLCLVNETYYVPIY